MISEYICALNVGSSSLLALDTSASIVALEYPVLNVNVEPVSRNGVQ
jgi:hypothetical protein